MDARSPVGTVLEADVFFQRRPSNLRIPEQAVAVLGIFPVYRDGTEIAGP
jgi:hypothetical protein